ncbi:MAG: VWA domain-containing protein [Gammaproteobacteria bacterium]|nr:VWA domain-containing protein [Gammaproteobacteria bacterium]
MKRLLELAHCRKTTELYLRALWGRGFVVNALAVEDINAVPVSYLTGDGIHLPERILATESHSQYYRAAAAHAALHVISGASLFEQADLNLMQRALIGLVEDLRLELRAIKQFPGLRQLWLSFHHIESNHISALQLMLRLSRSVLDPKYQDTHHWVLKGKKKILDAFAGDDAAGFAMEVGLSLANDLGQMRLPLNSGRYEQAVAYRDDNRCLWQNLLDAHQQSDILEQQDVMSTQQAKFVEASKGIRLQLADNQFQAGPGFHIVENAQAALEYRQTNPAETPANKQYPEWDYRIHALKQDWCNLQEDTARPGSLRVIAEITARHKYTLNRLQRMASKLRIEKHQWLRKREEGEQFDLDYMVDAMVAVRGYLTPDPRVFMRSAFQQEKNLAISILLDLSESTNERIDGSQQSVSQVLQESVYLLGETLSTVGDAFAIAGFSSNGRQQIRFTHFKYFNEEFEASKARLSEIAGAYSTRLGAAIRHSAGELALRPERKKLLLVITDGAPSDIDVYDRNYLVQDCWHAVRGLYRQGIRPFCINLDRRSDASIEHIFGRGRSETLDSVVRLPGLLAHLYMRYLHT